jgi:hypothetical protein
MADAKDDAPEPPKATVVQADEHVSGVPADANAEQPAPATAAPEQPVAGAPEQPAPAAPAPEQAGAEQPARAVVAPTVIDEPNQARPPLAKGSDLGAPMPWEGPGKTVPGEPPLLDYAADPAAAAPPHFPPPPAATPYAAPPNAPAPGVGSPYAMPQPVLAPPAAPQARQAGLLALIVIALVAGVAVAGAGIGAVLLLRAKPQAEPALERDESAAPIEVKPQVAPSEIPRSPPAQQAHSQPEAQPPPAKRVVRSQPAPTPSADPAPTASAELPPSSSAATQRRSRRRSRR